MGPIYGYLTREELLAANVHALRPADLGGTYPAGMEPIANPLWSISSFGANLGREPRPVSVGWDELRETLTVPRVWEGEKKHAPAWSPCVYPPGLTRGRANVDRITMLVLDYDDGTPIDAAHDVWSSWAHLIHTSWSHTSEHPKYRVVLPLLVSVAAIGWSRCWKWAEKHSGRAIDKACKDPSRLYFGAYVREEGWPFEWLVHDGPQCLRLDWKELPEPEDEAAARVLARKRARGSGVPIYTKAGDPDWKLRAHRQEELKTNPDVRRAHALGLDGDIRGKGIEETAEHMACPQCGRASVWYWVAPFAGNYPGALCHHEKTCGWKGFLDQI